MSRTETGFTLVELIIVVVVIGLLAAIAIPNYLASESRAREASVKSNMHTLQLVAEDFKVRSDSSYAGTADDLAPLLPGVFKNPFDKSVGKNGAWEDRLSLSAPPNPHPGISSYSDSLFGLMYNIKGYGRNAEIPLILTTGK